MFASVCACSCGLVHRCPCPHVCACVSASRPLYVSVCEHPGGSPVCRHAQPTAHGELTGGQGLGREAPDWLSTPRGCWNRLCFPGKLMRMSCETEPTATLRSRQMTAPLPPLLMRPVTLSLERKLNWPGTVCCFQSQAGRCCVMCYALLGGV